METKECPRCGKDFKRAWELRRHLLRKTACAPILEARDLPAAALEDPELGAKQCRFCCRVFAAYDSMRRHVRDTCKIAPNARNGNAGMERLVEHTIRQQSKIEEMQDQMTQMTDLMQKLVQAAKTPPPTIVAGDTVVHGDRNVVLQDRRVVNINIFGEEATGHVTMEKIRDVLKESLQLGEMPQAATQAVLKAALLVYSDPDHPENLTCYLPNKREGSALVHTSRNGAASWEIRPLKIVGRPMAQRGVDLLFDKQPFEGAEMFEPLMKELRDNEARYVAGGEMKTILVRNKALLTLALEKLPMMPVGGAPPPV
jgi:hypothetical protein